MKKLASIMILMISILALAACSTAPQSGQSNPAAPAGGAPANNNSPSNPAVVPPTGSAPDNNNQGNPNPPQIPDEMRLVIGTFKLEGTDQAVTAAQADALLPLWQSLQEAQGSMQPPKDPANATPAPADDTSRQNMDEQIKQIQAAMTPEQLKAIEAMQITQADVQAFLKEQGLTIGGPNAGNGTLTPPQGTPPAGDMPGGAGGPGGGGNDGQGNGAPNPPQGTPMAGNMPGAAGGPGGGPGGMLPPGLLDALIQFLQKKAGS